MIIGLASPRVATSLADALAKVDRLLAEASTGGARIVCFPEAWIPGLRGIGIDVFPFDAAAQSHTLGTVSRLARAHQTGVILGMERITDVGRQIVAAVFDETGRHLGFQTKNQLDPSEDAHYVPGHGRHVFDVAGLRFGIAICHEGWRYPETVRWAARRGATIVFHPQQSGSDTEGVELTEWGSSQAPYYEKAMVMRSIENTIYFASVNYTMRYQESATSIIGPTGTCLAHQPYGKEGVLLYEIDPAAATALIASRFAPDRYAESE